MVPPRSEWRYLQSRLGRNRSRSNLRYDPHAQLILGRSCSERPEPFHYLLRRPPCCLPGPNRPPGQHRPNRNLPIASPRLRSSTLRENPDCVYYRARFPRRIRLFWLFGVARERFQVPRPGIRCYSHTKFWSRGSSPCVLCCSSSFCLPCPLLPRPNPVQLLRQSAKKKAKSWPWRRRGIRPSRARTPMLSIRSSTLRSSMSITTAA